MSGTTFFAVRMPGASLVGTVLNGGDEFTATDLQGAKMQSMTIDAGSEFFLAELQNAEPHRCEGGQPGTAQEAGHLLQHDHAGRHDDRQRRLRDPWPLTVSRQGICDSGSARASSDSCTESWRAPVAADQAKVPDQSTSP